MYDATLGTADDWSVNGPLLVTSIETALTTLSTLRDVYITERKLLRLSRLDEIHEDHLFLIDAPFQLQLDLLQ